MVTLEANRPQTGAASSFQRQPSAENQSLEVEEQKVSVSGTRLSLPEPLFAHGIVAFGATIASIYGLAAVVLTILGLSGVLPATMTAVATIVVGLSLAFFGRTALASARLGRMHLGLWRQLRFWGGVISLGLAGLTGVVLGILGLVFSAVTIFGGIVAIVFGAAMLEATGITMSMLFGEPLRSEGWFLLGRYTALAAEFIVGFGVIVLGILALLHLAPVLFPLISLLALGFTSALATSVLCGTTLGARQCR
jgi:hypothetical protein